MYKLLALDLDGTLLSNNEISHENKKVLAKIRESGIYVVLCSGRSFMSMERFVTDLDLNTAGEFGICYNGGMVYKTLNNEPIHEVRIPNKTGLEIFDVYKRSGCKADLMCYVGGKLFIEGMTDYLKVYIDMSKIPFYIEPFNSLKDDFSKILVCGEKEDLIEAKNLLSPFIDKTAMHFSSNKLLEVIDKNVGKGAALSFLADYLGIAQSEVIAAGDNHNDLSMIQYAGFGVAVANAASELKAAADVVLESTCDQDAIKELAEKFIWRQK